MALKFNPLLALGFDNTGTGSSGISGYSGAGISGYSGYSGLSGYSSVSGYSGKSGYSRLSGYSGSGVSDYSGLGLSGYSGTSGYSGSGGGLSWGTAISGADPDGLSLTFVNNSTGGNVALKMAISNTQSSPLSAQQINLGASTQDHTAIEITSGTGSAARTGIYFNTFNSGANNGIIVFKLTTGDRAISYSGSNQTVFHALVNDTLTNNIISASSNGFSGGSNAVFLGSDLYDKNGAIGFRSVFYWTANDFADRTGNPNSFESYRQNTKTSGTLSDNYSVLYLKRTSVQNGAGGTFAAVGSVLKLENVSTQTAGTLTDSTSVLSLLQGAVTSTNFKKLIDLAGVTLWVSNGTTANGNLTGTAGDICFNAGSNKPEYCTGTTNWTALV